MSNHHTITAEMISAAARRCGAAEHDVQRVALGLAPRRSDRDAIVRALEAVGAPRFVRALHAAKRFLRTPETGTTANHNQQETEK